MNGGESLRVLLRVRACCIHANPPLQRSWCNPASQSPRPCELSARCSAPTHSHTSRSHNSHETGRWREGEWELESRIANVARASTSRPASPFARSCSPSASRSFGKSGTRRQLVKGALLRPEMPASSTSAARQPASEYLDGRRDSSSRLSWLFLFMILWVVASTFNYGFGISELNALASALACAGSKAASRSFGLPVCFDISSSGFGIITALFTLGGLLASLLLSPVSARLGWTRRQTLGVAATINCLGTAAQAFSPASWVLGLGRGLMGMSAGIAIAIVPAYLNDLAPVHIQGSIGVLNQLSIVIGILAAQALGVSPLGASARTSDGFAGWRWVPIASFAISALQLVAFRLSIESPREAGPLREKALRARLSGRSLGGGLEEESEEQDGLLGSEAPLGFNSDRNQEEKPLRLQELLSTMASRGGEVRAKRLRKGLFLIVITQLSQQLSGVNAVLYYSSSILSDALGTATNGTSSHNDSERTAKLIALGITIINALMTFPPLYLVSESRLGRKKLLLLSASIMCASNAVLAIGILNNVSTLSALSIVTVVAGFSLGLGPVPFLILPELVEPRAVTSASALGISLNWTANLLIASLFLPLRNVLAGVDGGSGGSIFGIFAVINAASVLAIRKWYNYESRDSQGER